MNVPCHPAVISRVRRDLRRDLDAQNDERNHGQRDRQEDVQFAAEARLEVDVVPTLPGTEALGKHGQVGRRSQRRNAPGINTTKLFLPLLNCCKITARF